MIRNAFIIALFSICSNCFEGSYLKNGEYSETYELQDYLNKPVSDLLENKKYSKYTEWYWIDEPPMKLKGAVFYYPNGVSIEVYINTYNYVKHYDHKRNWNFDDFKKENISSILLFELIDGKETLNKKYSNE